MAERLSSLQVIESFEDYELDHLAWFALAGANMIDSAGSFDMRFVTTSTVPHLPSSTLCGDEVFCGDDETLDETSLKNLRLAQLFNAGRRTRWQL